MCERGILAGGDGGRYAAKGAVLDVFWRRNTPAVPFKLVEVVAGVRPVCIQWRRVEVAGGEFVGMSISIMSTAYEVPLSLVCVPIWGIVDTAGESVSRSDFHDREFSGNTKTEKDVHHFERSLRRSGLCVRCMRQ